MSTEWLSLSPIIFIWMGLAFVVLFVEAAIALYGTVHLFRDALGVRDTIWFPALKRNLKVKAIPRHFFRGGLRFSNLHRCERFGNGRIECAKACLLLGEKAAFTV